MQLKAETRHTRSDPIPQVYGEAAYAMTVALRYRPALIRFFERRSTAFASEAEDLAQEVFLRLLQRSQSGHIARLEGYIFQVASSVLVDRARHAATRRGTDHTHFEEWTHAVAESIGADRLIEGRQDVDAVKSALLRLPESARQAFLLSRFEDMSYAEIASGMGVSVSSVEKYIMRALREITLALAVSAGHS